jgi:hypothetical protein
MSEHARVRSLRSAMTKIPRIPPSSTDEPPPPSGAPPVEAEAPSNPFASLAGSEADDDGATKAYQVPRELIELARANADSPSSGGTLTPIAPRPNAELEATLAAYTAGLSTSGRVPSSRPGAAAQPPGRREVETLRSTTVAQHEESGTVLRREAAARAPAAGQPRSGTKLQAVEQRPLLRSPIAPRNSQSAARNSQSAAPRPTPAPRSKPASTPAASGRAWLVYLGLGLILSYCAHLLLSS